MALFKHWFSDLKLLENNDESTKLRTCYGCGEVIAKHSWYYFGKDYFGYEQMLHKFCGELPTEMAHPFHPHLLKLKFVATDVIAGILVMGRPSGTTGTKCNFCSRSAGQNFWYICGELCFFEIDLICGGDATLRLLSTKTPKERARMALKDLSHPHQLKLFHPDDDGDDADDDDDVDIIRECKACLQPIFDSSYYICTEESEGCKQYFLHRLW